MIDNAVALATSASEHAVLQANPNAGSDAPKRWFVKTGLVARIGVASEIIVPARWADRVLFEWGSTERHQPSTRLTIGPCAGRSAWIAFPGGYYLSEPACIDIVVRVRGQDHNVTIAAGAPCTGQAPTSSPTNT